MKKIQKKETFSYVLIPLIKPKGLNSFGYILTAKKGNGNDKK